MIDESVLAELKANGERAAVRILCWFIVGLGLGYCVAKSVIY